jgi:hypothetical protein
MGKMIRTYWHGFGFVDANHDGINDVTGHGYVSGYGHGDGGHLHDPVDWPMEPPHMGNGGMV